MLLLLFDVHITWKPWELLALNHFIDLEKYEIQKSSIANIFPNKLT